MWSLMGSKRKIESTRRRSPIYRIFLSTSYYTTCLFAFKKPQSVFSPLIYLAYFMYIGCYGRRGESY